MKFCKYQCLFSTLLSLSINSLALVWLCCKTQTDFNSRITENRLVSCFSIASIHHLTASPFSINWNYDEISIQNRMCAINATVLVDFATSINAQ